MKVITIMIYENIFFNKFIFCKTTRTPLILRVTDYFSFNTPTSPKNQRHGTAAFVWNHKLGKTLCCIVEWILHIHHVRRSSLVRKRLSDRKDQVTDRRRTGTRHGILVGAHGNIGLSNRLCSISNGVCKRSKTGTGLSICDKITHFKPREGTTPSNQFRVNIHLYPLFSCYIYQFSDYPDWDLDQIFENFRDWEQKKIDNILTYRENCYKSGEKSISI